MLKRFGFTSALINVSLAVEKGQHTILLGSNGSGKSTLIKLIAGLIKPSKGSVIVLGRDPFKASLLGKEVTALTDDFTLPTWMKGYEFLKYVSIIRGSGWKPVEDLAKSLRVVNYWRRHIATYSAGMRKRIALVAALIGNQKLIMLDDPFTALDSEGRAELLNILAEKGDRATIILSTHSLFKAKGFFRRAVLLDNGKKVLEGEAEEVMKHFTESFQ